METILQQVRDFADQAHGEQMRKYAPERYIQHPLRVMAIVQEYSSSTPILAAALLHDVLEDTPVNKQAITDFLQGLMPSTQVTRTVQLVEELTDVYVKANYPHWNRRKRKSKEAERMEQTSADAQTIKYADIMDNAGQIVDQDPDFAKVFLSECRALLKKMEKGHTGLRDKAAAVVDNALSRLSAGNK